MESGRDVLDAVRYLVWDVVVLVVAVDGESGQ
jgi:hypothetical protein